MPVGLHGGGLNGGSPPPVGATGHGPARIGPLGFSGLFGSFGSVGVDGPWGQAHIGGLVSGHSSVPIESTGK